MKSFIAGFLIALALGFTAQEVFRISETGLGTPHGHVYAVPDTSYNGGFTTRQYRSPDPRRLGEYVYFQLPVSNWVSLESFYENPVHTHDVFFDAFAGVDIGEMAAIQCVDGQNRIKVTIEKQ